MDIVDNAQHSEALFHQLAMRSRSQRIQPVAAKRVDENGHALCLDCDVDITNRRLAMPSAQRCVECQQDADKRSR